jgi:hypothetical protein
MVLTPWYLSGVIQNGLCSSSWQLPGVTRINLFPLRIQDEGLAFVFAVGFIFSKDAEGLLREGCKTDEDKVTEFLLMSVLFFEGL